MNAGPDYRLERLEQDVQDVREELRTRYLDKYQLMNEYLSRLENEQLVERSRRTRREWPVILGALVVSVTSIAGVILQVVGH